MSIPYIIPESKYSTEEIRAVVNLLEDLVNNSAHLAHLSEEQRIALIRAAGQLSRPMKDEFRKRKRDVKRLGRHKIDKYERKARAETGIRSAREATVFTAPLKVSHDDQKVKERPELKSPQNCYVCKQEYTKLHFFMIRCARRARNLIMPNAFKLRRCRAKLRSSQGRA